MKRLFVILAGAALLLWLSLMRSQDRAAPAATPQSDDSAPAVTAAPAARPAARPAPVAAPVAVPAKQAPVASAPAPSPTVPVPASNLIPLPPRRARPHFTAAQAREGSPGKILSNAFAHENPDPAWSGQAVATIKKTLAAAQLTRNEVFAVDCRTSVCKLQMRFNVQERDKFDAAFAKLHEQFGTDLGFEPVAGMDNHGEQIMRVFVMREGKTLDDFMH